MLGETEVDQRDAVVIAQHHVAGLEVAMKNSHFVDGLQRVGEIARERQRLPRGESFGHALAQVAAREMLHRQEQVVVGDAEIVDAHDVRMADLAQHLEFLQEALHRLIDAGFLADGRRDLEHHHVAMRGAFGEEQLRHRTLRDEIDAPVFLEARAGEVLGHLRARRTCASDSAPWPVRRRHGESRH